MADKKVEKTSSVTSIGFGQEDPQSHEIPPVMAPLPYDHYLYDSTGFAIKCQHKKMPILKINNGAGLWLPFVRLSPGQKWEHSIQLITEFFFKDQNINETTDPIISVKAMLENVNLASISRLQLPHGEFVTRNIYYAKWKTSDSNCCKNTSKIEWHLINDVIDGKVDKFWGSEVIQSANSLNKFEETFFQNLALNEFTKNEVFKYFLKEDTLKRTDKNCSIALFDDLLKKCGYNENVIIKIYSHFIQHCYPSWNMSFHSFRNYINKIDWNQLNETVIKSIFKAFNYGTVGYIGFNEFFLGLAIMDPMSPHGHARCAYIFRYYDSDSDGFLDKSDLYNMVHDIHKFENKPIDSKSINESIDEIMEIPDFVENNRISYDSFISTVGALKFRGTSSLFRSEKSLHELISFKNCYESIGHDLGSAPFGQKVLGVCPRCRPKKYQLSVHSVKLKPNGRIVDPKSILFTDGKDVNLSFKLEDEFTKMSRKHSMERVFQEKSDPNCVLEIIRELGFALRSDTTPQTKQEVKQALIAGLTLSVINNLCKEVSEIFKAESRVIKINSPCFVMGDIHGNLLDLLAFEDQLWRMGPHSNQTNVLFEGDYVDLGEYSVEVVLYLFSMKILAPNKFFLLRGNHEIRTIQKCFTFEKECNEKYRSDGRLVFEIFNNAFDVMPIVALIDETIYCAHGGIPYSVSTIEDLIKIPTPLREPEHQSLAAWEILRSDPISSEEFEHMKDFIHLKDETGFISNTKRSTAFFYSEKAINTFLKTNSLSHIIRAHSVEPDGYKLDLNGKVITIFSCSRYCGSDNKAACIFIDGHENEGLIKIITLDT